MLIILYTLFKIIQKTDFFMKSAFYCPKPLILLGFKLGHLAEEVGFEPTRPLCRAAVFETAALNHLATPPRVIRSCDFRNPVNGVSATYTRIPLSPKTRSPPFPRPFSSGAP